MNESSGVITDARELGTVKMLILGLQHMFAMFGATILVPILVNNYFGTNKRSYRGSYFVLCRFWHPVISCLCEI